MLLRVKACSVCKHLCDRRWEELRRVEKSWPGLRRWEELRWAEKELRRGGQRWEWLRRVEKCREEVRRVETSWEELRRGGQRWEWLRRVEKCREEVKRVELRWEEMEQLWELLKRVAKLRRAEMAWEELRSGGHNWKGVRQSDDEFTEQSWEAVRVRCISYRQTLSLDPIASQFLNLETSATHLARVLLVMNMFSWSIEWHIVHWRKTKGISMAYWMIY